jgi:integrase
MQNATQIAFGHEDNEYSGDVRQNTINMDAYPALNYGGPVNSTMRLAAFIEKKFVPDHVEQKSPAGRTHYQAILKHVLRPETVERMFAPYTELAKGRLKALPDWPYLDNVRLCDLRADHIRQLMSSAAARGYSPQTIKHIRNVISAVISHARRQGFFSGISPICEVELPPMIRRASPNLTSVQTKAIFGLMKYPEREIALIMIATEMSVSEICALKWKHVNLTESTVYSEGEFLPPRSIKVMKQWTAGKLLELPSDRVRNVVVPEALIGPIARLKPKRRITGQNSFVIATGDGNPICPAKILSAGLKPIGRKLDMPWLSWQVLKRSHRALVLETTMKSYGNLLTDSH